jgi:lipopolysaccharide/colanic/teichoic acid biosynthesis glycosyltransferase
MAAKVLIDAPESERFHGEAARRPPGSPGVEGGRVTNEPVPVAGRLVKRCMDVILGTLVLVIAAPFMALAALAVRLDSPGSVLFRQARTGMGGRPFQMLKFRTMHHGADSAPHEEYVASLINGSGRTIGSGNGGLFKLVDDDRVTRVGRFLRRFSLDELPQLFNVLRGDMSLVGPRPPIPYEVSRYSDWHGRRLDVRPGMTGLWQVSGRSRLSYDDMVRLDLRYIDTWSLGRDVLIMLKTMPAMARGDAS